MQVPQAVSEGMQKTNRLFSALVREKNYDGLDDIYTKDARVLPPGAPLVQGREAIKGFWQQAITTLDVQDVELSSIDVETVGDGAVEIGRAVLTLASGNKVTAKYVVQWKQEDGGWKWHTDIWNMNE